MAGEPRQEAIVEGLPTIVIVNNGRQDAGGHFDGTLAKIEELGVSIWFGPKNEAPNRMVFIDGPDNVKIELLEAS